MCIVGHSNSPKRRLNSRYVHTCQQHTNTPWQDVFIPWTLQPAFDATNSPAKSQLTAEEKAAKGRAKAAAKKAAKKAAKEAKRLAAAEAGQDGRETSAVKEDVAAAAEEELHRVVAAKPEAAATEAAETEPARYRVCLLNELLWFHIVLIP